MFSLNSSEFASVEAAKRGEQQQQPASPSSSPLSSSSQQARQKHRQDAILARTGSSKKKKLMSSVSAPAGTGSGASRRGLASGGDRHRSEWPAPKRGGVVLDLMVDLDVKALWQLFVGDSQASTMWRRFCRHRKYEQVTMQAWDKDKGGDGVMQRKCQYITGFKSHFIRGKHTTYETHTATVAEEGKTYVLVNETRVPTLPVGDCMHTVIQYCFAASKNKQSSFLRASYEIVYTKKTSLKSVIEKSTAGGIKDSMRDLRATLATIAKVRDATAVPLDRKLGASLRRGDLSSKFETMVTHEIFRFLMQYPHAILAFLCFLYLLLDTIQAQKGPLAEETFFAASLDGNGANEVAGEDSCPIVATDSSPKAFAGASAELSASPAHHGRDYAAFCRAALFFWFSGHLLKFLVLACHWLITNLSILALLLLKTLKPVITLCAKVAKSEVVRKVSVPVKKTLTVVLKSLEIRNTRISTNMAPEDEAESCHSPGEVVPAAAEAAMVVSKIAKFSGLSPAAQAQAVKGLRDKKQAQLVSQSAVSGRTMKSEESGLVVEEVFENQRYQPFRGWGSSWPGHLLPTDCGKWSDRIGLPKVGTQSQMFELVAPALPPNWVWLETEWQIDFSGLKQHRVDKDGFYYGVMAFSSLKDFPPPPGSGKKNMKQFIRRRRWSRTRIHSLKIREVLMDGNASDVLGGDSTLKAKIESLLGWRRVERREKAKDFASPQAQVAAAPISPSSFSRSVAAGSDSRAPSTIEVSPVARRKSGSLEMSVGQDVILEEIFEQEERADAEGEWKAPAGSLKRWANRNGSFSSSDLEDFEARAGLLPTGWKWVGHWIIDNTMVDGEGWLYAAEFGPMLLKSGEGKEVPAGSKEPSPECGARRRRWIRHRRCIGDEDPSVTVSTPVPGHSSMQLDALDLPPSPSETESGQPPKPASKIHRRSSSKSTIDVLDLSTPLTYEKEGWGGEECSTPTLSPKKSSVKTSPGGGGPLAAHLETLERKLSEASIENSVESAAVSQPSHGSISPYESEDEENAKEEPSTATTAEEEEGAEEKAREDKVQDEEGGGKDEDEKQPQEEKAA